jgi:putative ABC transport system permease protein
MLKILFTIALRNVLKNRKRSLFVGLAVCLSCAILLLSGALANGAGRQLAARYRDVMSGDVTVVWENVKEIDPSDAGRLYFSEFDPKKMEDNRRAVRRFREFCQSRADRIEAVYEPLRAFGMLDNGTYASFCMIYGLSDRELGFLEQTRVYALAAGESANAYDDYAAVISQEMAADNHIGPGQWFTLDAQTPQGYVNSIEFCVVGLYKNAAPWDNKTVYVSEKNARELLQWDAGLFAQARVYLKRPATKAAFARDLDAHLLEDSLVLRAEPNGQTGEFYLTFGQTIKGVFVMFTVFLLFVIGLGIRSTVRINVFERLGEFGTLRALGFARRSAFLIVFFEVLVLSLAALAAALALTLVLTLVFSLTGLFVGNGVLNSLLGGEYVYPVLDPLDVLFALGMIALFSLLAPLKPALRVTLQKITDLLARNQKQLFATVEAVRMAARHLVRRRNPERRSS